MFQLVRFRNSWRIQRQKLTKFYDNLVISFVSLLELLRLTMSVDSESAYL